MKMKRSRESQRHLASFSAAFHLLFQEPRPAAVTGDLFRRAESGAGRLRSKKSALRGQENCVICLVDFDEKSQADRVV